MSWSELLISRDRKPLQTSLGKVVFIGWKLKHPKEELKIDQKARVVIAWLFSLSLLCLSWPASFILFFSLLPHVLPHGEEQDLHMLLSFTSWGLLFQRGLINNVL